MPLILFPISYFDSSLLYYILLLECSKEKRQAGKNERRNDCNFILQAIDRDVGQNAALSYAIVSGNQEDHFKIESKTGNIISAKNFAGNSGTRYELSVSVKDNAGVVPFNVARDVTSARVVYI